VRGAVRWGKRENVTGTNGEAEDFDGRPSDVVDRGRGGDGSDADRDRGRTVIARPIVGADVIIWSAGDRRDLLPTASLL
jgi:hypothetical protein